MGELAWIWKEHITYILYIIKWLFNGLSINENVCIILVYIIKNTTHWLEIALLLNL